MTIQAVSFGKQSYTDNGNKYNKTKAMGYTGLAVGGGISAYRGYQLYRNIKEIKTHLGGIMNANYELYKEIIPDFPKPTKELIARTFKGIKQEALLRYGINSAIVLGIAFALGKAGDCLINRIRAKNADKPVMLKQEKIDS